MDPVNTTPETNAVPPAATPVEPTPAGTSPAAAPAGTSPAAAPAGTPPPRKPRAPSAPQPLRIVKELLATPGTPAKLELAAVQPPDTVTEKVELVKWLKDLKPGALPAGKYRIVRDMGPVVIGVVSEPKATVSFG